VAIDKIADESSLVALGDLRGTQRAVALARGMNELRKLISGDVLAQLTALAGTDLGYRTDMDAKNKSYPPAVIRDCLIEGMLRGANVVGNEINIIAGKCYLTKAYFERMVRGLVSELRVVEGVPELSKSGVGALVPMRAAWKYMGHADSIECTKTDEGDNRIAVRVNSGMGVDAILGKAYRKLFARIYRRLTGSDWIESEESQDMPETPPAITIEPSPPVKQSETPEGVWLTIESTLQERSMIKEVDEYRERAAQLLISVGAADDDLVELDRLCNLRKDAIRASRGGRANVD